MAKNDVLKFYSGVFVMLLTYRLVFSFVLITLETAEQIALQDNLSSDRKNTGSKNRINNFRGGQANARSWLIRKLAEKVARTALYKKAQEIAISCGVVAMLGVMRGVGSYDWWAVYISHAVINLTEEDRIILSSLRRLRLGLPLGLVCVSVMTDMQLMLYDGDFKGAIDEWMVLLTRYDKLSERDPKKNGYFSCIVLFITGALVKYPGFVISLLRYLQYLCVTGKISYATYLEILWQILLESESERVPIRQATFNFVLRNFFSDY